LDCGCHGHPHADALFHRVPHGIALALWDAHELAHAL
jgi:hypothetical protein